MSKQGTVEVTMSVPKNVVRALREFILKYDTVNEREYWEREAIQVVVADIDYFVDHEKIDLGDPQPTLRKYGLLKYTKRTAKEGEN